MAATGTFGPFVDICRRHETEQVRLDDFGNGVVSMPVADPGGNGWLPISVSYFMNIKTGARMGVRYGKETKTEDLEAACKAAVDFVS